MAIVGVIFAISLTVYLVKFLLERLEFKSHSKAKLLAITS